MGGHYNTTRGAYIFEYREVHNITSEWVSPVTGGRQNIASGTASFSLENRITLYMVIKDLCLVTSITPQVILTVLSPEKEKTPQSVIVAL